MKRRNLKMLFKCFHILIGILLSLANLSDSHSIDPVRLTRSTSTSNNPSNEGDHNGEIAVGRNENLALMSWLHGHIQKIGNTSEEDLRSILNSLKLVTHPESDKFPRLKVYNYNFPDTGDTREVLVYSNPDDEKQFIVTIDDLDLRQNLIVFKLGDLGFGFAKDNTYVVLRRSMSAESFHYMNLAYILPRKIEGGTYEVEWDNVKPRDLQPIPLILKEPDEAHEEHCSARKCGLKEFIFGTCAIVKLTCEDLRKLPLEGHEKERIEALLREKEPFIYELARALSLNNHYLQEETGDDDPSEGTVSYRSKRKRSVNQKSGGEGGQTSHMGEGEIGHHSVKKDHALTQFAAANFQAKPVNGVEASMQHFQRQIMGEKAVKVRLRAPALDAQSEEKPIVAAGTITSVVHLDEENANAASSSHRHSRSNFHESDDAGGHEKPGRTSYYRPNGSAGSSAFDKLLARKSPVTAANLTLGMVPIETPMKLPEDGKSYFDNVLEKIRNSPPSKYTVRPYECVACEPMGSFMSEYSDNPLVSYIVNNLVGDIFRDVLAQRKIFSPEPNEVLQEHGKIPYVGYGGCEYSIDALEKSPKSMEYDDIIDFYSESLAFNCEKKDCEAQRPRVRMRELLTSKSHLLTIWPDLSVRINKTSDLPRNLILSTNEFRQFMTSLIFSAYTMEYRMQTLDHVNVNAAEGLPNHKTSPRMKFISRVLLKVVDELVKNFPQHIVKGMRYLLQILQEKYLTLIAEQLQIMEFNFAGNENERQVYMQLNKADRLQVLALKDFLINGISPITRSRSDVFPAFTTFFSRNQKRIKNMVIEQGIGHEHKDKRSSGKPVRSAEVDQFWESINGGEASAGISEGGGKKGQGIAGERGNVEVKDASSL